MASKKMKKNWETSPYEVEMKVFVLFSFLEVEFDYEVMGGLKQS